MKLLRYGPVGQEKPGLLDRNGQIRDLSGAVRDIDGESLSPASLDRLRRLDPATLPLVAGTPRLGPCVGNVAKIVAIGLNYRLHAQEAGAEIPKEPIFFMKATSSICGPNDDTIIPKGAVKTDYEVELGIVIGSRASYIAVHDAPKHIAGYCVVNDVSEREFQIETTQTLMGVKGTTFAVTVTDKTRVAVEEGSVGVGKAAIKGGMFVVADGAAISDPKPVFSLCCETSS